ncbi:hypothetical protein [Seonamhaeicola maritimus]|uniref:GLPGLI family protein n=1 Tax=Seonamhaeicola maritimus TaxID=2591822 RepID=A0A5C7GDT8_9FLAO|nr:hypothetical protein [Seonamhaeicola maritimus]TXG35071.1 hypothetical protein FUA22_15030 [Seonamhaeicola maritimus]
MKPLCALMFLTVFLLGSTAQAQLLDALKKRAKEKGLETQEVSYDPNAAQQNSTNYTEIEINKAEDFFTKDVIMETYNANDALVQTSFFDKEVIAMRTESRVTPKPIYHDRKGKFYAYNAEIGKYENMSLLPSSSMGFMTAGMTTQVYKLPQEPYFEAFEALSNLDIAMNFLVLELAFIYKPFHFEDDEAYSLSEVSCGNRTCKRFNYNDQELKGSYIQFDDHDRLVEFYIISKGKQLTQDERNPSGKFKYYYKESEVILPENVVERSMVPGPLGKIIPLEKGLEPWKHNKKDKKKN